MDADPYRIDPLEQAVQMGREQEQRTCPSPLVVAMQFVGKQIKIEPPGIVTVDGLPVLMSIEEDDRDQG